MESQVDQTGPLYIPQAPQAPGTNWIDEWMYPRDPCHNFAPQLGNVLYAGDIETTKDDPKG